MYNYKEIKTVEDVCNLLLGGHISAEKETKGMTCKGTYDETYTSRIMGKMLTIIDSCITDKVQRESMKSLVKQLIHEEAERYKTLIYDQFEGVEEEE